ncbi:MULTISPECIES: hypothetical protein [Devosia]|uniref:hypothetical protein n=1 Tax=Devosia TaxID=46913 RepID=UPI000CE9A044|nr:MULTISPECIES: hypothetical protein [Devosia]AVF02919.1 hypothetical protein C4375_03660 [Devosia sp. I507]
MAAINRPSAVTELIPEFRPTTADASQDTGLAMLEAGRARANPGPYRAVGDSNTQAVDAAFNIMAPNAPASQFSAALETQRADAIRGATEQVTAAQQAFDNATRGLAPIMTGDGRGANIRTALEDASASARAIVSEAWRPLDQGAEPVDIDVLRAAFGENYVPDALRKMVPDAANSPSRLIDPEDPGSMMQPISEVMGIRSALASELRRDGITDQEARVVEQYVTRLDDYLDQNVPQELSAQYSTARTATRDYHDRFTRPQTAIGQTLSERQGQPRYPDSAVAGRFVQSDQGRIADFEALMREAGSDERVQTAVRDQILQDVQSRGLLENPQALDDYLGQYGTVFGRFPQLREQLGSAGTLRAALADATTNQQRTIRDLTSDGKSAVQNYLKFGHERAQDAMRRVIADPDPAATIDELLNFAGNDRQAIEGARSAFWQVLEGASRSRNANAETASGIMPLVPRKMLNFLDNPANAAVAQRLYRDNPEHLTNIRAMGEALRDMNTGPRVGSAVNPSGTALLQRGNPTVSMAEVQSKLWQAQIGRVNPMFVLTHIAGKLSRRLVGSQQADAFNVLLDRALLDPAIAAELLKSNNPANRAAMAQKARGWLGSQASTIVNALSEGDEEDETNAAIMRMEALN